MNLVGRCLAGFIYSSAAGIPVYMPITLSIAEAFSNDITDNFDAWNNEVGAIAEGFHPQQVPMCQG